MVLGSRVIMRAMPANGASFEFKIEYTAPQTITPEQF
jgi:hypothetical protein